MVPCWIVGPKDKHVRNNREVKGTLFVLNFYYRTIRLYLCHFPSVNSIHLRSVMSIYLMLFLYIIHLYKQHH